MGIDDPERLRNVADFPKCMLLIDTILPPWQVVRATNPIAKPDRVESGSDCTSFRQLLGVERECQPNRFFGGSSLYSRRHASMTT